LGRYSLFSVLKIGSRKSPLAKIQAYQLFNALKRLKQDKAIELVFKETQGDIDLTSPLWKISGKGVFTRDFREDLISEKVDMVVHSWKDLDLDPSDETEIISVFHRADQRDILLLKKESLNLDNPTMKIMSSSPRREYNLKNFLPLYLPLSLQSKEFIFEPVRGNIQTRLQKWQSSDSIDGFVVAKAALDRLLSEDYPQKDEEDIKQSREYIREILKTSLFMCLPLSLNPNAPAQGALAVEIKKGRDDLKRVLRKLTIFPIQDSVIEEREELKNYGGGCHQKIGISVLHKSYGKIVYKQGMTEQNGILSSVELHSSHQPKATSSNLIWPNPEESPKWDRIPIEGFSKPPSGDLFVSRINAWQDHWQKEDISGLIWSAGLKTMRELAKKDIWVNGTSDGLGEEYTPNIGLLSPSVKFKKLTHSKSEEVDSLYERIPTYDIIWKEILPEISGRTHFFWMSGHLFDFVYERFPDIHKAFHACGPGITRTHIEKKLLKKVDVFLNYQDWFDYHTK
jgi:hydroxymethylbilane synthase